MDTLRLIKCCVCLNSEGSSIIVINDYESKNSWLTKLQNIVPEVEWLTGYKICRNCLSQLEVAFEFKNLCLSLDYKRKETLIGKLELIYNCYHCNEGFYDKNTLAQHIQQTHLKLELFEEPKPQLDENRTRVTCDKCSRTYSTPKILKSHQKKCGDNKTRKKPNRSNFSCEVCNLVMDYAKSIIEHCVKDHSMDEKSVKPYTCDECPMRFSNSTNYIQHKKYHSGSRSHVCTYCGKAFITKNDLTVHEYTHLNRRNYKCNGCDKAFNTNKNLWTHKLVVHTDSNLWKYTCDTCNRRFPLKSGFDQHVRRHNGDKRFSCRVCEKQFVSKSEMQKHVLFHSRVKPYKCPSCDKCYKDRRSYGVHLARSHGVGEVKVPLREKKFVCHACPSAFFSRAKLERHLRGHEGAKPHEGCPEVFHDQYYRNQRLKNLHSVKLEQEVNG